MSCAKLRFQSNMSQGRTATAMQAHTTKHVQQQRTFGGKLRVTVLGQDFFNHLLRRPGVIIIAAVAVSDIHGRYKGTVHGRGGSHAHEIFRRHVVLVQRPNVVLVVTGTEWHDGGGGRVQVPSLAFTTFLS